ncbi:MAG TPA: hypothetical protein VEA81_06035 [Burkholderiaceae bacterium]|nr:hypothetical protein [Burkholderiaceae bacterium]
MHPSAAPSVPRRPDRPPLGWRLGQRLRSWLGRLGVGAFAAPEPAILGSEALHPVLPTIRALARRPRPGVLRARRRRDWGG